MLTFLFVLILYRRRKPGLKTAADAVKGLIKFKGETFSKQSNNYAQNSIEKSSSMYIINVELQD